MKIPFNDLTRIHEPLKKELDFVWNRVISNNAFILGEEVARFEKLFSQYCGFSSSENAVGVSNGLDALTLILSSLNIKEGDEVITQANTFNATVAAICSVGARPVLVDVNSDTGLMNISKLEKLINLRTKAIIPVHLYGQQVEIEKIYNYLPSKNEIYIVEDAAQAHGALRNGLHPGQQSTAAAFSMYPGKNLGAFGDAGIVVSKEKELIKKIKILQNYGQIKKNDHEVIGSNKRMDGLQAAILSVKLSKLDEWNLSRKKSAQELSERLEKIDAIELPKKDSKNEHIYHLFVIKTDYRDELRNYLFQNGIETGIHYPVPIHLQKPFLFLEYQKGSFPISEDWSNRGLSLPLFPFMSSSELEYISTFIRSFFKKI